MSKPEIECIRCDWFGYWEDCRAPRAKKTDPGSICPKCKSIDSMVETDSVGPNDYDNQNPVEPVNE